MNIRIDTEGNRMKTIEQQIIDTEDLLKLLKKIPCTKEEIEMCERTFESNGRFPDGMFYGDTGYYKVEDYFRDREDRKYLLNLQRTKYLKTIKNCVMFFTVSAVIGIITYIFTLLSHM